MNKPNSIMLRQLRRAVRAQRAAREALNDLAMALSENQLSEQMYELLEEEVIGFELNDTVLDLDTCRTLLLALSSEAP